jgi:hypothetical protein
VCKTASTTATEFDADSTARQNTGQTRQIIIIVFAHMENFTGT